MTTVSRSLDDNKVYTILTSEESLTELGKRFGVSPSLIHKIRHGHLYKQVHPELPRKVREKSSNKLCIDCIHYSSIGWDGHKKAPKHVCGLNLPDIKSYIGIQVASHCAYYLE